MTIDNLTKEYLSLIDDVFLKRTYLSWEEDGYNYFSMFLLIDNYFVCLPENSYTSIVYALRNDNNTMLEVRLIEDYGDTRQLAMKVLLTSNSNIHNLDYSLIVEKNDLENNKATIISKLKNVFNSINSAYANK